MKRDVFLAVVLTLATAGAADAPWMNTKLPPEERARLLTAAMTLEEKADELLIHFVDEPELYDAFTNRLAKGRTYGAIMKVTGAKQARELQEVALAHSRLKIPFIYHEDVTHGFRTVLPVGLGTAATWNPGLVERCEAMAAKEAVASGFHLTYAPMCDISDDPRWGRICETSGESPYLSAAITAALSGNFEKLGQQLVALVAKLNGVKLSGMAMGASRIFINSSYHFLVFLYPSILTISLLAGRTFASIVFTQIFSKSKYGSHRF